MSESFPRTYPVWTDVSHVRLDGTDHGGIVLGRPVAMTTFLVAITTDAQLMLNISQPVAGEIPS